MLTLLLGTIIFAVIAAKYCYNNRRFYQLAAELPSAEWKRWRDSCLPLLGYVHRFLGTTGDTYDVLEVFARKTIEIGGFMKVWMGPYLYTMITDPAAAEIILANSLKKDDLYRFGKSWVGNGLVTADVHVWKRNRKFLNPAFSVRVTDCYLAAMNEQCRILTERLEPLAGKGIVDVENYMDKCALGALCKSALGSIGFDLQTDKRLPFLEAIHDQTNLLFTRAFRVWLHPSILFHMTSWATRETKNLKVMHEFSRKIIRTKREELRNRPKNHECDEGRAKLTNQIPYLELLLKLCDEEKFITEAQLGAEVDTVLEAGYTSSSVASGLLLSLLGKHPQIQEKLYNEIKQYYGGSTRDVEKLDFQHLPYLDCVVKEVFRIYPPTPVLIRRTEQEVKISDNITLPAGCGILISSWGLHHDPKVWGDDHETFRPERWEDSEAATKRHTCSYIPFSHGARNCIGKYHGIMQFKIVTIHLMRQYRVYVDPAVPMTFKLEIFMKQRHGVHIAFEKR